MYKSQAQPVAASLDPTGDDDPSADPGAEVDHDEVAFAAPGTETPFGPDRGVGVVVDRDRQAYSVVQRLTQWLVPPGQVWGEDDRRPIGVDESGGPDAHSPDLLLSLIHISEPTRPY